MPRKISEIMTKDPAQLTPNDTVMRAAHVMRDRNIGDLIVSEGDRVVGIVTDRDLVVRSLAEDKDPNTTKVGDICTRELARLSPDASIHDAVETMRQKAVRRLVVVENERPIGVVSLGDLAIAEDPKSALGQISSAPPQK